MKKTIFAAVLLSVMLALAVVSCVTRPQNQQNEQTQPSGGKGSRFE